MPVWLRRIASRRSASIVARACWPVVMVPSVMRGDVAAQPGEGERRVEHLGDAGVGRDRAGVAHLSAALGVEGRAVEEQLDGVAVAPGRTASTRPSPSASSVADELGDAELLDDLAVVVDALVAADAGLAGVLGAPALLGHLGLEAGDVDADAALGRDLGGDLEREAVGVVQRERRRARQRRRALGQLAVEDRQAGAQRLAEALLFPRDDPDDEVAVLQQVGVRLAHHRDGGLDQATASRASRRRAGRRSARHGAGSAAARSHGSRWRGRPRRSRASRRSGRARRARAGRTTHGGRSRRSRRSRR